MINGALERVSREIEDNKLLRRLLIARRAETRLLVSRPCEPVNVIRDKRLENYPGRDSFINWRNNSE